jgi:hypothetical protein
VTSQSLADTLLTRGIDTGSVKKVYAQVKTAADDSYCLFFGGLLNGNTTETYP